MELYEHPTYKEFPYLIPVEPPNISGFDTVQEMEKSKEQLESLWFRLKSIAGEFSHSTGLGVLVATRTPHSGEVFSEEFYVNFLPRDNNLYGAVKVKPVDCERCFKQKHANLDTDAAIEEKINSYARTDDAVTSEYEEDFENFPKKDKSRKGNLRESNGRVFIDEDVKKEDNKFGNEENLFEQFKNDPDIFQVKDSLQVDDLDTKCDLKVLAALASDFDPNSFDDSDKSVLDLPDLETGGGRVQAAGRRRPGAGRGARSAKGETSLTCELCGKTLSTLQNLNFHKALHTGESQYKCSVCGRMMYNERALKNHMRLHTGEKPFKCKECPKAFADLTILKKHILRMHEKSKPFKCDQCDKAFCFAEGLKNHRMTHIQGEKPFKCTECDKGFYSSKALRKHTLVHTAERSFLCNLCGKGFKASHNLKNHLDRHHKVEKPHTCNICGMGFWKSYSLLRHEEECKGEGTSEAKQYKTKEFRCETCQKTFSSKKSLEGHMRGHNSEKPFQCSDCGKSFAWEHSLKVHFRKHTGEKPYECDICARKFASKSNYSTHRKRHTDNNSVKKVTEKAFQCDTCEKMFSTQSNLDRHKMIHNGLKPFKCDVCGKGFIQSQSLKMHFMTHTGEKPWKCNFCERAFSDSRALKNHCKIHTEDLTLLH